ncbi:sensor histidine kinase [Nonomuraea longicatena]|uniref:histidine kinase n=1 Tax=Nonomuraea longicatena TaxID=83682 RepID=A0ABP4AH01_9ACTN
MTGIRQVAEALRGLLLNAATGLAALGLLVMLAAGVLLVPVAGVGLLVVPRVLALVRLLARAQRWWAGGVLERDLDQRYRWRIGPGLRVPLGTAVRDPATWRDLGWLAAHSLTWPAPILLLAPLLLALDQVWSGVSAVEPGTQATFAISVAVVALAGTVLAVLPMLEGGQARLTGLLMRSDASLTGRVRELMASRAAVLDAQAAELRRIERDLHDGAQAKLIAIRMNLALLRSAPDPEQARALIDEAGEVAGQALAELRDLVRGIHPPVLADRGLAGAVEAAALLCPMPVHVEADLPEQLEAPLESAMYFAAAEALTNVAKHSGATAARVRLRHAEGVLRLAVWDNGRGGAGRAGGTGLRGIEHRLSALDGTLTVTSPPGGPTELTMELPCA